MISTRELPGRIYFEFNRVKKCFFYLKLCNPTRKEFQFFRQVILFQGVPVSTFCVTNFSNILVSCSKPRPKAAQLPRKLPHKQNLTFPPFVYNLIHQKSKNAKSTLSKALIFARHVAVMSRHSQKS